MFLRVLKQLRIGLLLLPFFLVSAGTIANIAVVTANHGAMPVVIPAPIRFKFAQGDDPDLLTPGEVMDKVHTVYDPKDIHLKVLCDWIQVPRFGVVSPGDLVLWTGEWASTPVFCFWLALLYADRKRELEYRPDLY